LSENTTQEFKKDGFNVIVETESGCRVRFKISLDPAATKNVWKKAIKTINKEVSIPGFRKGRAPDAMITKHYQNHIEKEWKEELLQSGFRTAVELSQLHPFREESIYETKLENASLEEGSQLLIGFESFPKIPEIDMKTIQVQTVVPQEVTEKLIDQVIEDFRFQFAEWSKVDDRAVQEGDFVDLDIENLDKPGEFLCEDYRMEVKEGKLGKWLHKLILGMKPGEAREGVSELEEGKEAKDFTATNCKIVLKAIQQSTLPEKDDALAEKMGVESFEVLRKKIAEDLKTKHEREAREETRRLLEKEISKAYPFDIPDSLVKPRVQAIVTEKAEKIRQNASDSESIAGELNALEAEALGEVLSAYRWYFISQKIARDKKINVNQQELIEELMRQRYLDPQGGTNLKPEESTDEVYSRIYSMIIGRKVADFFLEQSA